MARGEKVPWHKSTAVTNIVWDETDGGITLERSARPCEAGMTLRPDATVECAECGLPMTPVSESPETVTVECANRHRVVTPLPADRATRALIDNWIAKKGAQLHVQHERWESEEDEE
ncbi:MAG: hypothetical protein M3O80_09425 [Chloroflexota bacterium]|nr:hypothetical protein [Chloroflexota bacterium]